MPSPPRPAAVPPRWGDADRTPPKIAPRRVVLFRIDEAEDRASASAVSSPGTRRPARHRPTVRAGPGRVVPSGTARRALIGPGRPGAMAAMTEPPLRRALIGEFLGTALLVLLGDGVVASVVLLDKQADWIVITTGWALAVTLADLRQRAAQRRAPQPGRDAGPGQPGASSPGRGSSPTGAPSWPAPSSAALVSTSDYAEAFAAFERAARDRRRGAMVDGKLVGPAAGGAGVFATYPAFDDLARNLFSEFLGTAVLLLAVRALTDRRNAAPGPRPRAGPDRRWWSGRSACRWGA